MKWKELLSIFIGVIVFCTAVGAGFSICLIIINFVHLYITGYPIRL